MSSSSSTCAVAAADPAFAPINNVYSAIRSLLGSANFDDIHPHLTAGFSSCLPGNPRSTQEIAVCRHVVAGAILALEFARKKASCGHRISIQLESLKRLDNFFFKLEIGLIGDPALQSFQIGDIVTVDTTSILYTITNIDSSCASLSPVDDESDFLFASPSLLKLHRSAGGAL